MQLRSLALSLGLVTGLTACGGGGGGNDLTIQFSYPSVEAELFEPVNNVPTITGLDGNQPQCNLESGALAAGLSLSSNCIISGRATQPGLSTAVVRLTVRDFRGAVSATVSLNIRVPQLLTAGTPEGNRKVVALAAGSSLTSLPLVQLTGYSNSPARRVTFELASGTLPLGLVLDSATGALSGSATSLGDHEIQIGATVSETGFSYQVAPVALTVRTTMPALQLWYPTCCVSDVGVPFVADPQSTYVPITGAVMSFSLLGAPLPAGIVLDAATGRISGTPAEARLCCIGLTSVIVQSAQLPDGRTLTASTGIAMAPRGPEPLYMSPVVATPQSGVSNSDAPSILSGLPGDRYTFSLRLQPGSTMNGNAQFGTIPPGFSIDSTTGVVSATATGGTTSYSFELEVVVTTVRNGGVYVTTKPYLVLSALI